MNILTVIEANHGQHLQYSIFEVEQNSLFSATRCNLGSRDKFASVNYES